MTDTKPFIPRGPIALGGDGYGVPKSAKVGDRITFTTRLMGWHLTYHDATVQEIGQDRVVAFAGPSTVVTYDRSLSNG